MYSFRILPAELDERATRIMIVISNKNPTINQFSDQDKISSKHSVNTNLMLQKQPVKNGNSK